MMILINPHKLHMSFFKFLMPAISAVAIAPFLQAQDEEKAPTEQAAVAAAHEKSVAAPVPAAVPVAPAVGAPSSMPPAVPVKREWTEAQLKQLEMRLLQARKALIDTELALERTRLSEELAPRKIDRARLEIENALRVARSSAKLAEIDNDKRKLDATLSLDKARSRLAVLERENKLRDKELDVKLTRLTQDLELLRYNQEIAKVQAEESLRELASVDVCKEYRKDPLENGKLYISDRRIELDGPILPDTADFINERIYFYNNQSTEYPIFLVIENSPGGSVAAGYQIIKAMESSKAPVYVVVKGYAASMAAMITSLADRSFCFRNSVLMQHQPSTSVSGNLTQLRESIDQAMKFTRVLNDKIAAKMGMTYDEYVAEMYKHNSQGNWTEFGDDAHKWKWVTDIVDTIDETSVVRKAKQQAAPVLIPTVIREQKIDERGKPYYELPTLPAGDAWLLYNPHNLYRIGS